MPYTFPTTPVNTTNLDAGTKSPAAARTDLLTAVQTLNTLLQGLGVPGGFPGIDANAQVVFGSSFLAGIMGGNARITLSSTAYLEYNRTTNALEYWLGGSKTASVPFSAPFDYGSLSNTPAIDQSLNGGVLSLSTDPFMGADLTAPTSVYFIPINSDKIGLYSAGLWWLYPFTQQSINIAALPATTIYDVFAYWNGSSVALEYLAWTSWNARAVALTLYEGIWCKNGDRTRRWVGSFATDTTAGRSAFITNYGNQGGTVGAAGGKVPKCLVFSANNRRHFKLASADTTSSWTIGANSWRVANNQAANHFHTILYAAPDYTRRCELKVRYRSERNFYGGSGYQGGIAIGSSNPLDNNAGVTMPANGGIPSGGAMYGSGQNPGTSQTIEAEFGTYPTIGLLRYYPMEYGFSTGYGSGNVLGSSSLGNMLITELEA